MSYRWAPSALGVVACFVIASAAWGQRPEQRVDGNRRRGSIGPNEPNPFSGQTTIPFTVGDANCAAGAPPHVVTLRIYNILSQVVAFATLVDSAGSDQSAASAPPRSLTNLSVVCGRYAARWDGKNTQDGRDAAPGVYMYQLLIDGHPSGMRKMLLKR